MREDAMHWPDWLTQLTDWPTWFGYTAMVFGVVTCWMRTMMPLRVISMVCNVCFMVYGFFYPAYPTLLLNLILLPLNAVRLHQMMQLVYRVEEAARGDFSYDWLKPYMSARRCATGDVLFRKGDVAEAMFYTVSGAYRLLESGLDVPKQRLVGELGLIAPGNRRTQTLVCTEAGEVEAMTYAQVKQLYYQNPKFGFYFLQLTTERLFQNLARLEQELEHKNALLEAKSA
jgi:hypothetical protein